MATRFCPLHPSRLASMNWGRSTFEELEIHVKSSTTCCHPELKDLILTGFLEGSTPLLMACQNGDIRSVIRIVNTWGWGADINRAATFYIPPTGIKLENVTPLYVAAKYHHREIVRFLIKKGANVSAKTANGETPLYAAIARDFFGNLPLNEEKQLAIIRILLEAGADPSATPDNQRPVWLEPSCYPEILELLVKFGLDLSQQCPLTGNTVLHLWASRYFAQFRPKAFGKKSLRVVKLLLENGADLHARNNIGFTPLYCAAVGDTNLDPNPNSSLYVYKTRPNFSVFEYLLDKHIIRRIDKIYALELAGSVILYNDDYEDDFQLGFDYWRRALALRLLNSNGCSPINKNRPTPPVPNHPRIIEWNSYEDLQLLEEDPSQWRIQIILTRFRILSNISWECVRRYFWTHVDQYCDFDPTPNDIVPALSLSWTVLEKALHFHQFHFRPVDVRSLVRQILRLLVCIFDPLDLNVLVLNSEILKTTIDVVIATYNLSNSTNVNLKEVIIINEEMQLLYGFIAVLSKPHLREFLNEKIMDTLSTFVRRDIRDENGFNFLHRASIELDDEEDEEGSSRFLNCIQLLLQLGMDAKAVDKDRNTPLHVLVKDYEIEGNEEAARLLLEACGERCDHCDLVNNQGMTATEILVMKRKKKNDDDRVLPDWCRKSSPKLSCLCARVIQVEKVPYLDQDRVELPPHLYAFIQKH